MPPRVSVLVLNYDGLAHLEPCFASLRQLDYPREPLELVLVDNGSSDGSVAFVRDAYPEVRVVTAAENLGFAAGNNLGARQSDSDYVVFLNNDMKVEPAFVRELVDAVAGQGPLVCAGAKILDWEGQRIDYAGGTIDFAGRGHQRGYGETYAPGAYDEPGPTAYACGGAMIVDRSVFLDVGGFDEGYFSIFEDVDLGWRLWLYGHEVGYAPRAVAYHRQHGTLRAYAARGRDALARRNATATIFKNYDDENMPRALAAAVLDSAARVAHTAAASGRLRRDAYALGGAGATETRLSEDEAATLAAVADLVDELPRLREQRAEVQSRRVRADADLAPLFRLHVTAVPREAAALRASIADALGVSELLQEAPRRVLVFSPDLLPIPGFPTVGSGLRAWGLGQGLRSRGHEVVFSMPRMAIERLRGRYEITREVDELAWAPLEMHKIVERTDPDVALVCGWAVMESLVQGDVAAVPVVLDQHGPHMLERDYQGHGDRETNAQGKRQALAAADYFTCAGERQLEYFQSWLEEAGWPEGDRTERSFAMRFSLSPRLPERRPAEELTFVYGGVWLPWQDPTAGLLALVEQLDRRGTGTLRLFGGRHPWIEIEGGAFERIVARLEQSPHVVHEGQVAHAELVERYAQAHVALDLMKRNPERELAFTSRTVEFLWCGLPVLYNDYSELSELIDGYDAGWTVDPDDAAAIHRALDEIFERPGIVRAKSENARRLAREQLCWEETIEPLDRIVRTATRRVGAVPMPPPTEAMLAQGRGVARAPSLHEKVRWVVRNQGARALVGKGVRAAGRRLQRGGGARR